MRRNKHREAVIYPKLNMSQMKNHEKTPEKAPNAMEARNLPDIEFKILVIRMLNKMYVEE